jgi:hypothetical protein
MSAGLKSYTQLTSGVSSYFGAKIEGYAKQAQAYAESIQLYQQLGAQTRQLQQQQAVAYMNSNVDISQGTAAQVIQRTGEQGLMKMNELKQNLDTSISNQNKITSFNANEALLLGIVKSADTLTRESSQINLYKQKYYANTAK